MFYGSVVFCGLPTELQKITNLVDDELILVDSVLEYEGPVDVDIDGDAILYNVDFNTDQWLDIIALKESISELSSVDVIHALTDGQTFIEVISTNPDFDDFDDSDDDKLEDLSRLYNISFRTNADEVEDEDDDHDMIDEELDDNWD